jgi:hypothetical protein
MDLSSKNGLLISASKRSLGEADGRRTFNNRDRNGGRNGYRSAAGFDPVSTIRISEAVISKSRYGQRSKTVIDLR